jgi:hypothetical protein
MVVISQVTGMDNSHLLPPHFPVFRGEDYLFGAMVEYLHPHSTVLEYDWCVPHFPMEQRSGTAKPQPATNKGEINLSKYITDRTLYESGVSAETRLSGLGQMLRELSETSNQGLLTVYRAEVAKLQNSTIKQLSSRLNEATPRTKEWNTCLQQSLNNVSVDMGTKARLENIIHIPEDYNEQAILDEFRAYSGEFALALASWVEIRKAAKSITATLSW